MLLRSRKYITNNIRRYTHSNSQSSIKDPILNKKLDKIMLNLDEIEIKVKGIYYVSVITGLLLIFK
jgi:hypothetical protein